MRNVVFASLLILVSISGFSQDSLHGPKIFIRPFFETGIDFIQSDYLKDTYNTKTKTFWAIGLQFGHADEGKVVPYVQYTRSSYSKEVISLPNTSATEYQFLTEGFNAGFIIPVVMFKNGFLKTKIAYSYARIKEPFSDTDDNSNGIQFGFGYEKKVFKYSRIFVDLTYNYQKTIKSAAIRDLDMTKLSVGFVL